MPVPRYIDDGNFAKAMPNGAPDFSLPFSNVGDNTSFEMRQLYRQDARYYRPIPIMTTVRTQLGNAYLVAESPTRGIGNGLLEFYRTFASVPITRNWEGTSINYPIQFVQTNAGDDDNPPTYALGEINITLSAQVVWEYFLFKPPIIYAPKAEVLFQTFLYKFGGYGLPRINNVVPAQDSTVDLYKGLIYYRKTLYVAVPIYTVV